MIQAIGHAASGSFSRLKPLQFGRDDPEANEVEVLFCGVRRSDIHQVKNEWGNTAYPCMPGHEAVGRVTRTGGSVTLHKAGDLVGVGCMIDSCRACAPCHAHEESCCQGPNGWLATFDGSMMPAAMAPDKTNSCGRDNTHGGCSTVMLAAEDFVLGIPAALKPEVAAPILSAASTRTSR